MGTELLHCLKSTILQTYQSFAIQKDSFKQLFSIIERKCKLHRLNKPYRFALEKVNKTLTPEELRAKNECIKKQVAECQAKMAAERQSNQPG